MAFYRKNLFPLLAGLLWLTFLTLDLTGLHNSTWVKYAAVCLCCMTALVGAKTTDGKLVAAALCFTVAADWFLLVRDDRYDLGIGLFLVVQALYACRLYLLRGKRLCKWGLAVRGTTLLLCGALTLLRPAPLTALPLFYFANLLVNTGEAFVLGLVGRGAPAPPSRRGRTPAGPQPALLFALGLLLFVFCDLCVGANALGLLSGFTWWGSWLFYLPSQALIVLSQEEKG